MECPAKKSSWRKTADKAMSAAPLYLAGFIGRWRMSAAKRDGIMSEGVLNSGFETASTRWATIRQPLRWWNEGDDWMKTP
jgi:hypothetical protein